MVSNSHNKCRVIAVETFAHAYTKELHKRFGNVQTIGLRTNASQQSMLQKCHVKHYFETKSVCLSSLCEKSGRTRARGSESVKTNVTDWEHNLTERKHYIHWYLCCSLPSWDTPSVITTNTWAASRLYTPTPAALHLGQEAQRNLPSHSRAAWSRQIITPCPGGTQGLEFCQTLLH